MLGLSLSPKEEPLTSITQWCWVGEQSKRDEDLSQMDLSRWFCHNGCTKVYSRLGLRIHICTALVTAITRTWQEAKQINPRGKKKSTVTSTSVIQRLVWIYRAGQQVRREMVWQRHLWEGQGRGQWCLTNLCHHYRGSLLEGENQCQKEK